MTVPRCRELIWLAVILLCLTGGGCKKSSVFECEVRLLLPATSVDPQDGRVFGRLTINGKEIADIADRLRAFKIKLSSAHDSLKVVYSFWPKTYTNIIRSKVIPVEDGEVVQLDLTKEDPTNPDKIRPLFITTPMPVVDEMCKMAAIGKNDIVYDIGCGDGRMVLTAIAKFGAKRGVGIDIDPKLIETSRENAKKAGVFDKIEFRAEDALKITDLSDADVVMLFIGEDLNRKLRPVLQKTLKHGARVISHHIDMGDWKPTQTKYVKAVNDTGAELEYALYLWKIE
jgi:predicted RNA methylase